MPEIETSTDVWSAVHDAFDQWRASRELTEMQLRTIRALLIDQLPLRVFAKQEGVSPAAISSRIEGLKDKAPQFFQWWVLKNTTRRGRRTR